MKAIIFYLRDYLREHFNARLYGATIALTTLLLAFNFSLDFEDSVIDAYNSNVRILWFFLMQGIPYFVVCFFIYFFTRNKDFLKNKEFWIVGILGFAILGIDRGVYFKPVLKKVIDAFDMPYIYMHDIVGEWISLITMVLPLLLFYFFFHRRQFSHFYGLRTEDVHLRPYVIMLLLMIPLIIAASFRPDFLETYPTYSSVGGTKFAEFSGIGVQPLVVFYEISYAFSFFLVELFFRGFLIFGLVKYLGDDVVLPMATTYCVLHFGKPLGEAISSFFGGYLLGVIALRTSNIYGGVMVHIGIALLMELFAYLQI